MEGENSLKNGSNIWTAVCPVGESELQRDGLFGLQIFHPDSPKVYKEMY